MSPPSSSKRSAPSVPTTSAPAVVPVHCLPSPPSLHPTAGSDPDSLVDPLQPHPAPSSSQPFPTVPGALSSTAAVSATEPQPNSPTSHLPKTTPTSPSQCTMQTPLRSPSFPTSPSSLKAEPNKTSSFFRWPLKSPSSSSKRTVSSPVVLPPTNLAHLASGARVPTSPHSLDSRRLSERSTSFDVEAMNPSTARPGYMRKRSSHGSGVNQVGRHSNDWLFGGFSVRETVKGIVRRHSDDSED